MVGAIKIKAILACSIFSLHFVSTALSGDQPFFKGLGYTPGGPTFTYARAISADGSVVVGQGNVPGVDTNAVSWSDGVLTAVVGEPSDNYFFLRAWGASADGSIIVGHGLQTTPPTFSRAIRWENGQLTELGTLGGEDSQSNARAVSSDGQVIVGHTCTFLGTPGGMAFRWKDGVMTGLGWLAGGLDESEAYGVSGDGSVVVGAAETASSHEAFRWTQQDGMVGLGHLPGHTRSWANAVSDDGQVIVGWSGSGPGTQTEAIRWQGGVMTGLGDLPGGDDAGEAFDVSSDGSVIVGQSNSSSGPQLVLCCHTAYMR